MESGTDHCFDQPGSVIGHKRKKNEFVSDPLVRFGSPPNIPLGSAELGFDLDRKDMEVRLAHVFHIVRTDRTSPKRGADRGLGVHGS